MAHDRDRPRARLGRSGTVWLRACGSEPLRPPPLEPEWQCGERLVRPHLLSTDQHVSRAIEAQVVDLPPSRGGHRETKIGQPMRDRPIHPRESDRPRGPGYSGDSAASFCRPNIGLQRTRMRDPKWCDCQSVPAMCAPSLPADRVRPRRRPHHPASRADTACSRGRRSRRWPAPQGGPTDKDTPANRGVRWPPVSEAATDASRRARASPSDGSPLANRRTRASARTCGLHAPNRPRRRRCSRGAATNGAHRNRSLACDCVSADRQERSP